MSNNETGFIKILIVLLVLGLTSGLTACQENSSQLYNERESDAIIGGEAVGPDAVFAKKVIYLAIGVEWTQKKIGTSVSKSVKQTATCTASAISPTVLLTAAHCVAGLTPSQINAVLSVNPWNHKLNEHEWIQVKKIKIHEGYIDKTGPTGDAIENDLALLLLEKPLPAERISKLASVDKTDESMTLISAGYGRQSATDDLSGDELVENQSTSLLRYVVRWLNGYDSKNPVFEINQSDSTGICTGDSGGPGYIYDAEKNELIVVAVASYVAINEDEEYKLDPHHVYNRCIGRSYYSNTVYFTDWIKSAMSGL